jgi:pre-mRNA-splicing helicase BRR2
MDLVLPEKKGAITEVTDCRLGAENVFATHPVVQEAYAGAVFDEITSTVLPALFRSDESVFVGTKAASIPGATIVLAEFAIWRAFIQDPNARVVYISAKGGAISGVKTRWGGLFKNFVVGELTGDSATDLKLLEASNIILSEAAPFEQLTRRWRSRKTVQTISLLVIDGLHMLGGEPLLEVIASRMRFMAAQLEMPVRLVAMSAPVWNPREIAAWLGVKDTTIFNFDVMAGVGPVHVQGFSAGNMDALMASMVGPAYRAMREHGRAVIWVSDIRQAKTLALDFAALAAASNAGQQREKPDIRTGDEVMDECLAEGVAYLEDPSNQAEILSAFANGHINMLILAKEYAYLLHPLTPLTIIMGTQEYNSGQNVDYAFNDMLALATNPGGMTLIMCHASKKAALTALFGEALPVESHLDTCFTDVLNAEICAKTVTSKQDAVDYLTWTLLYRRVARNPNYYGLKVADERALSEFLSELVEGAVTELDEAKCTSIEDEGEGGEGEGEGEGEESGGERLTPMNLGLIAAYYGVKCATIEMLALSLTATSKIRGILECISAAAEFDTLSIRKGEEMILERLYERVPVRLGNPNYARDPHVKANLLLQAHFSRFTLPTALTQDLNLVLTKALSLVHAAVDVLGSYGFLIPALAAMEFSQMLIQGLWNTDPPVKQLFDGELLVKALEREITSVYDIDESLLRDLPIQEQQGIAKLVNRYPSMDVKYSLDSERVVVGEEVIVRASISRQVAVDGPVTGRFPKQKEEAWWLVVGVPTTKALLGIKRFVMNADQVDVVLPFVVEQLGPLSAKLFLVCDCYAGADQEFPISVFVERAPDDETE